MRYEVRGMGELPKEIVTPGASSEADLDRKRISLLEREVVAREKMLSNSSWSSPLVVALFAATVGLLGNLAVTWWNNNASLQLERQKEQSAHLLQAMNTNGDPLKSCRNVTFLLYMHLVDDDPAHTFSTCPIFVQHFPAFGSSEQPAAPVTSLNLPVPVKPIKPTNNDVPPAHTTSAPSADINSSIEAGNIPGVAAPASVLTDAARSAVERVRGTYESGSLHKAIVVSDQGHDGIYINQLTADIALMKATAACQSFAGADDPCRLVYLDGKKVGTWN